MVIYFYTSASNYIRAVEVARQSGSVPVIVGLTVTAHSRIADVGRSVTDLRTVKLAA
jgi:hypothetical protein